ncbi:MAG: hypothetical protein AAF546_05520 [Verrucomicrobiota bacterium]
MKRRPLTLCFILCVFSALYFWKVRDEWKSENRTTQKVSESDSHIHRQEPSPPNELVEIDPAQKSQASIREGHDFNSIRRMMRRDPSLTVSVLRPDGSEKVNLQGTYQTASMARLKSDGSIEVTCFESFNPARDFLLYEDVDRAPSNPASVLDSKRNVAEE